MPIYEYQCQACDYKLEKLHKISDEPLKDCPSCEAPSLKKLVSAAAFRLKGSGWYETDFKTGSKKNVLHGNESSDSASKGGGDTAGNDSSSKGSSEDSGKSKSNPASNASVKTQSSTKD